MSSSRDPELLKTQHSARESFIKTFINVLPNYTQDQLERMADAVTFELWERDPNVKKD